MNIAQALALRGEAESYERQENAWLLEHITKIDSFDLVMKKDQELTAEQEQTYVDSLKRIEAGEHDLAHRHRPSATRGVD